MSKKLTDQIRICIGDCILVCLPETNMMFIGKIMGTGELDGMKSLRIELGSVEVDDVAVGDVH